MVYIERDRRDDLMTIEKAIRNAAVSIEMEGYHIDEQTKEWARLLLEDKITMDEYIALVIEKAKSSD